MEALRQQLYIQQVKSREWRVLQVYGLYRLCLVVTLLLLNIDFAFVTFSDGSPYLFINTLLMYLAFAVIALITSYSGMPNYQWQARLQLLLDIIFLIALVHINVEVTHGLSILMTIVIASSCIMLSGRISLFLAVFAATGLILEHIYSVKLGVYPESSYLFLAILSMTMIVTAMIGQSLSRRVQVSEAVASQRGADLANLEYLNEHIIQHLRAGVLVVDGQGMIHQVNETSKRLLGTETKVIGTPLSVVCPELHEQLLEWRRQMSVKSFSVELSTFNVIAKFIPIGFKHQAGALIFLDDMSQIAQKAQQMKLASLGRFTASIAHELRNPLGAVGHAVQLLQESTNLHHDDKRLMNIIAKQSERMNVVIKNILQLSRRRSAMPTSFNLIDYLKVFIEEFQANFQEQISVKLRCDLQNCEVIFDKSQLYQVLNNLCENSVRHSEQTPELVLHLSAQAEGKICLEVKDNGPGIDPKVMQEIFEPFFTTGRKGTGLGLYIARELCEVNKARLAAIPCNDGACFRILMMRSGTGA